MSQDPTIGEKSDEYPPGSPHCYHACGRPRLLPSQKYYATASRNIVCTRPHGHRGMHVAHIAGIVIGFLPDYETLPEGL